MSLPRNNNLLANAHQLRKEMTKEERRLWQFCLRGCPVKFYRQRVIGNYIVDFYAASAKLVIELMAHSIMNRKCRNMTRNEPHI